MHPFRFAVVVLVGLSIFASCASLQNGPVPPPPPVAEPAGGWNKIQPVGVEGLGAIVNDPNLIIDGKSVKEQSMWNGGECVWWTTIPTEVVVDLGRPCTVEGWTIQLATNNDWVISTSLNGREYVDLAEIKREWLKFRWGMETVSSLPGSPYNIPQIRFQPVEARYLKIQAISGVNYEFSVSEVAVFGQCEPKVPTGKK